MLITVLFLLAADQASMTIESYLDDYYQIEAAMPGLLAEIYLQNQTDPDIESRLYEIADWGIFASEVGWVLARLNNLVLEGESPDYMLIASRGQRIMRKLHELISPLVHKPLVLDPRIAALGVSQKVTVGENLLEERYPTNWNVWVWQILGESGSGVAGMLTQPETLKAR